jgi:hypothetical protein
LNSLAPDEVVLFADAVHPTHALRPVGCWTARQQLAFVAIRTAPMRYRLLKLADVAA